MPTRVFGIEWDWPFEESWLSPCIVEQALNQSEYGHQTAFDVACVDMEQVGQLADKAANFLAWGNNPRVHPRLQVNAMKSGLEELHKELTKLYIELAGHDPWQDQPPPAKERTRL